MTTLARRVLGSLAAITLGLTIPGLAHAQVPGGLDSGTVVITNSNSLSVKVNEASGAATQVAGTIQNTTGNSFRCATPGVGKNGNAIEFPGQVTEAEIVARAMKYYSLNVFQPIGGFTLDVALPSGSALNTLNFGSMLDFFPTGSIVEPLGNTRAEYLNIRDAQSRARINGHTGDPRVGSNIAFDVNAGNTVTWSAPLGTPASGVRTDFDAGAMFYCRDKATGLDYVFAGYETGTTPPAI